MMEDKTNYLQRLRVAVKGGGSLVSHSPIFSKDSKTLYIIQNNTLLVYNTSSGRLVGKFTTPGASPIANIAIIDKNKKNVDNVGGGVVERILVFTLLGELLEVEEGPGSEEWTVIKTTELIWKSTSFPPAMNFTNFIWPTTTSSSAFPNYFFILGFSQDCSTHPNLYSVQLSCFSDSNHQPLPYRFECKTVVPNQHSISVGKNGRFIAAVQPDDLFVKDMSNNVVRWHKAGSRKFTCVATHPSEWIVATGDDSGRILLWSNLFKENGHHVGKSIYHWHTLPVVDLCFSSSGTQIYSGGGECALIKWDLNDTGNKRTLPRLGLPIRHVKSSARDDMIAISQADNSVKLINPYNEVVTQIQNITQCYIPESDGNDINISDHSLGGCKLFEAGLHLDPNNSSLITNGKPGQLQCYSFKEDRHLYNLDITKQNFITSERNNPIPNSDVNHISFSKNGTWLSTVESRRDNSSFKKCTELRLKFWKFDRERQIFVLNTSIDWPHEKGIHSLKMQPIIPDTNPTLILATTGNDSLFKTWSIIQDTSSAIQGKNEWWNCEFIGKYRNLNCGPCSFSEDGSLLGIGFERSLTIWSTDNNELKLSLSHSKLDENISLLEFGSHQSSHLVIASSRQNLAVWDIITSSLLWVAPFSAQNLTVDPYSNLAAAFSSKNHLIFFTPNSSTPLAVHKNVSSSRVTAALFVPFGKSFENMRNKSTLFFINSSQELCALLPPLEQKSNEIEETKISSSTDNPGKSSSFSELTPFAQLIAEKTIYENGKYVSLSSRSLSSNQVGLEGYKVLRDIMDQSPHTMPSLTYYCSKLLQALNVRRNPGDKLNEMEQATLSSFDKNKTRYSKHGQNAINNSSNFTEDEDEIDADEFGLKMMEINQNCQQYQTFIPNLIVDEDLTWIDKVFEK